MKMQVICEHIKKCNHDDNQYCTHCIPHEHKDSCGIPCVFGKIGKITMCTSVGLRKEKLKKLNGSNLY